jgi:hypothetical protein
VFMNCCSFQLQSGPVESLGTPIEEHSP